MSISGPASMDIPGPASVRIHGPARMGVPEPVSIAMHEPVCVGAPEPVTRSAWASLGQLVLTFLSPSLGMGSLHRKAIQVTLKVGTIIIIQKYYM